MRYDAEHKEKTRAKVLAEAVNVIRTEGPERLGVADVMKRAGLTHGGFYAHFASREDMLLAATAEMLGEAHGVFERRTEGLPPLEALRAYVSFYLSLEHSRARTWGCPLAVLSSDLPRLPEAARARYGEVVRRLTEEVAGLFRALGRDEPEKIASSTLSEMIGALLLSRAVTDPGQAEAILARSRSTMIERLEAGEGA